MRVIVSRRPHAELCRCMNRISAGSGGQLGSPNIRIFIYLLSLVGFYAPTGSGLQHLLYEIGKDRWVWIKLQAVAWFFTEGTGW